MSIDEPTLTIVLGIASWIAGGMFFTLRVFARQIPGLRLWALGCFSVGASMMIDGPRLIGDWRVASMVFNVLFGTGQALILAGTMQFCGLKNVERTLAFFVILGIILTSLFTFAVPDTTLRITTLSAYQVLMNVGSAWVLWQFADPFARTAFRFASFLALLQASAAFTQGAIVGLSGLDITYAAPQLPLANIISWAGAMINILLGNWMLFMLVMLRHVAELRAAANIDLVTGLPNRRGLRSHIDSVLKRQGDHPGAVAVMLIDIDFFKTVNDEFGHHGGDKILTAMGEILIEIQSDHVAPSRWGGEEFCIVVENLNLSALLALAASIRSRFMSRSAIILGKGAGRTVSVGIAFHGPESQADISNLMTTADAQLYLAKNRGRDRIEYIDLSTVRDAPQVR